MINQEDKKTDLQKRCFVVMGFGVKTDYATGRKLDLDKSYRLLIKPVVKDKGLECLRADEIRHSGSIDEIMYRELLTADVVIADLSTANLNAMYELGIRHALRPWTTIVVSENKLPYPFDLNHINITSYTHLGDAIDYDEVERFRKELGSTLSAVLGQNRPDSPVYTYLSKLTPPSLSGPTPEEIQNAGQVLQKAAENLTATAGSTDPAGSGPQNPTLAMLVEQGEQAIKESRFAQAEAKFKEALELGQVQAPANANSQGSAITHDPYLLQRLVLAIYKSKAPDEVSALNRALRWLIKLNIEDSNDPETVGLAGAIEKRLFGAGQGNDHLNKAIEYYGRGYYLRNDYYNGINLAYLLNVRADTTIDATKAEKIADLVWANRIRQVVLELCRKQLHEIHKCELLLEKEPEPVKAEQKEYNREQKFWCLSAKAEAHFGLGELEEYEKTRSQAMALEPAEWMTATFTGQIRRLAQLLNKHTHLLTEAG